MELLVYDTNINLLGIIDTPNAVIWNRRFFSAGDFEIHLPANEIEVNLIQKQRYITKPDSVEFGVIESVTIEQTDNGERIKAVGHFGSSLLSRRIIFSKTTLNTTVEQAMRTLVYDNAIDTSGELLFSDTLLFSDDLLFTASRRIPNLELGTLNGFAETVSFQVTYKNLFTKLNELASTSGIAFRIRLDPIAKKIFFETYKAVDRSINQNVNPRVIFSQDYDNLLTSMYHSSDMEHYNVALVAGEGEGEERKIVIVGGGSDIERKEMFINAKDIRTEEGMTESEYLDILKQTGTESLIPKVEYFEGSVLPNGNATYKLDYDLGDIVTIENTKWKKRITVRINEITEIYDENGENVVPVFGEPLLTLSEQLSKGSSDTSGSTAVSPGKVVVSDNNGALSASDITSTELGYLDGVTSPIQAQINGKQSTITGGASTIVASNLTVNKALISDSNGKVAVSNVSDTELSYLTGLTGNVQNQLNAIFNAIYPVGSIYTSVNNVNPGTLFGGTWVSFGSGRTLVGVDTGQTEFNVVEKTGGAKTHTLTTNEIPSHYHALKGNTAVGGYAEGVAFNNTASPPYSNGSTNYAGGGQAHNNLQPYITVYMWKRTA